MPSYHLILCHPLLFLPSIFPSIRVFSNELALHIRWPKYWSFSFNINPSNEYSRLTSFRMDWFDHLAVQGTQEFSPAPQFESINSWALCLLYGPALTTVHDHWEDHSLDYMDPFWQSGVLLFNTLSRFSITLLPRSNCLLISWLQSPSAVILEPKKIVSLFPLFPCLFAMK